MKFSVLFTGLVGLAPVTGNRVVALLPNARSLGNVHAAGMHVPGHVPFLQWKTDKARITTPDTGRVQLACSSLIFGRDSTVLLLTGVDDGTGNVDEGDGYEFSVYDTTHNQAVGLGGAVLNRLDIIDMNYVVADENKAIDTGLVSAFDPDPQRVAIRLVIGGGTVASENPKRSKGFAQFKPKLRALSYSGDFAQTVEWSVTGLQAATFEVRLHQFGADPAGFDSVVKIDATDGSDVRLMLGNAPFEDILETGVGKRERLDFHFSLFYKLLDGPPAIESYPIVVQAPAVAAHPGGANCPPAIVGG
jgi:hypothetical protein